MTSIINISDFSTRAVFEAEGKQLRDRIISCLDQDKDAVVNLDFSNIINFSASFFNACIGYFVLQYSLEYCLEHIHVLKDKITDSGWDSYQYSLNTAIEYKANQKKES